MTTGVAKNAGANTTLRTEAFIACMAVIAVLGSIWSNPQRIEQTQAQKKPKIAPHSKSESRDISLKKMCILQSVF